MQINFLFKETVLYTKREFKFQREEEDLEKKEQNGHDEEGEN